MSAYLLPCTCGKEVPVDIGQAGGVVTCSCGNQLEVPTLRQLRHLQRETVAEPTRPPSTWGARQGIFTASLIGAAICLGWSVWLWWIQPVIPKFEPAARMRAVEEQLKTPAGAWQSWIDYYRPMAERGFPVFRVGNAAEIEAQISHAHFLLGMMLAMATLFAVVALSAKFWPQSPSQVRRA